MYACTHPNPQFSFMAETSTFGIFCGRNVRAEMSAAEMSYIYEPSKLYLVAKRKTFQINGVIFELTLTYLLTIECHFNHYLAKQKF